MPDQLDPKDRMKVYEIEDVGNRLKASAQHFREATKEIEEVAWEFFSLALQTLGSCGPILPCQDHMCSVLCAAIRSMLDGEPNMRSAFKCLHYLLGDPHFSDAVRQIEEERKRREEEYDL